VHAGIEDMVKVYQLKSPGQAVWRQYLSYIEMSRTRDLNYSISNYRAPRPAWSARPQPWTIALLGLTTLFSFAAGTVLGTARLAGRAALEAMGLMPPLWAAARHPVFSLLGLC